MLEQAVVLCAGRGKRLGSLTDSLPKSMLPVPGLKGAEPLLASIIRKLQAASFKEILLVVGYRSDIIIDRFRRVAGIRFAHQRDPNGTAAALEAALPLLQPQFLLTYGDLIIDEREYRGIRTAAIRDGGDWAAVNRSERPVGAAYITDNRITRIIEKPETCSTPWNTSGLFVLTREAAELSSATTPSVRGERELAGMLQLWIDRGNDLKPYFLTSKSIDIGTSARYNELLDRSVRLDNMTP